MECDFTGKAVLVTGSSRGIGRGIAEAFHAAGAHVAFNGRNARAVDEAIKDRPRTLAASGDVTVPEFARQVVEQTGLGSLMYWCVASVAGARYRPVRRLTRSGNGSSLSIFGARPTRLRQRGSR